MKGLKLCLSLLFAVVVSITYSSYADAASTATNACEDQSTGLIRILLSGTCNTGEKPISLNIVGAQGPAGPKGPAGPRGNIGLQGPQGRAGAKGPAGSKGDKGLQGIQGLQGVQGAQGLAGPKGPQGPAGLTWKGPWSNTTGYAVNDVVSFNGSAYICTAANNNAQPDGNAAAWKLLAQKGDQGTVGQQGTQGLTGSMGQQGPQGLAGIAGAQGSQGQQGTIGPAGPQGPAGERGATGAQGPQGTQGSIGPAGTGIKVYDANNQYLGNLVEKNNVVFVPGINKIVQIADDGNILASVLYYESTYCSGDAYIYKNNYNMIYSQGSNKYMTGTGSILAQDITYNSYWDANGDFGPAGCVNASGVLRFATYGYAFAAAVEVALPFNAPVVLPLRFTIE